MVASAQDIIERFAVDCQAGILERTALGIEVEKLGGPNEILSAYALGGPKEDLNRRGG